MIVRCRICDSEYNSETRPPRVMGRCGHSFCTECIESMIEATKSKFNQFERWLLKCPFDKREHLIKRETTVKDFPVNYELNELLKEAEEAKHSRHSSALSDLRVSGPAPAVPGTPEDSEPPSPTAIRPSESVCQPMTAHALWASAEQNIPPNQRPQPPASRGSAPLPTTLPAPSFDEYLEQGSVRRISAAPGIPAPVFLNQRSSSIAGSTRDVPMTLPLQNISQFQDFNWLRGPLPAQRTPSPSQYSNQPPRFQPPPPFKDKENFTRFEPSSIAKIPLVSGVTFTSQPGFLSPAMTFKQAPMAHTPFGLSRPRELFANLQMGQRTQQ